MDCNTLWLTFVRRTRQGHAVIDYQQLHAALADGPVPPGVALYRTRANAKSATWWATHKCNHPVPGHLVPVTTTGAPATDLAAVDTPPTTE